MAINIKDPEDKLGKDKVEEITEREWKTADLPDEEELKSKKPKNPKARNNINSRKNLIQYRKDKTKEQKEKMVSNLKYVEKEEDIDPEEIIGSFAGWEDIEQLMPALDVLSNRKEQEIYYNFIKLILKDFDPDDLTSSDLDDIVTLALNRVIEYRLLAIGAKNPIKVLEAAPTIEKFRKFSEKIKSSLANRRVDRVDVKNKPAFSIVDLAAELDEKEKADFDQRMQKLEKEKKKYNPPERDERGFLIKKEDDER